MRVRCLAMVCLLAAAAAMPAQVSEPLTAWRYFQEVDGAPGPALSDVLLDVQALDGLRDDGADLRLYDAADAEVPYALRVLRDVNRSEAFEATEFNRSSSGLIAEVTLDLGASPDEHNEVEVDTSGSNFRRRATLLGSPDGSTWLSLRQGALLFRFSSGGRGVDERRIDYPPSRYRYLRVQVSADPLGATRAPNIETVVVRRRIEVSGEETVYPGGYPVREATRDNGRPASAYRINLQGRIPLHGLRVGVAEGAFSRPYRLERIDGDPAQPVAISSGNLSRTEEQGASEIVLRFDEVFASELRLVVTDDRNPPLELFAATAVGAARQVVFESPPAERTPLKLYYGNASAGEPRYDFASTLPPVLPEAPQRHFLSSRQFNPDYRPPERPFTERAPWAVYLVLAIACLALFWVLRDLVGKAEGLASSEASE